MNNRMYFSIIIASYNYSSYISKAIESVISQIYTNWEMIIVDDGSTDDSVEIIKQYCEKDSRIKLYTHPNNENKGLAATLQLAIEKSQGEFLVFLESDDYIRNDYLSLKSEILNKHSDVGFIYNDIDIVYEGIPDNEYTEYQRRLNKYWKSHDYPHKIIDIMHYRNCVPTFSCVTVKKELLENCDFNSPNKAWLDYWLWIQLCDKTKFYYIQEKLTYWIRHDNSYISKRQKQRKDLVIFFIELYQRIPMCTNGVEQLKFSIFAMKNIIYYTFLIIYLELKDRLKNIS